jgi:hypothetical protein
MPKPKTRPAAVQGFALRKLADKSQGPRFDERTGAQKPWPCLGLIFVEPVTQRPLEEPPARMRIAEKLVTRHAADGLMTRVNERIATAPGGPPHNPNAKIHVFVECDEIIVHLLDEQGQKVDARYKVLRNPGKYPCSQAEYMARVPEKHRPTGTITATAIVTHEYECELIAVAPTKVQAA